jgi:phosphoribosyl-ATP pyrophosphohydrolase/phosphoribosyl-AMP cyclohydrolase/histidinol dehydrogenase
VAGEAADVAYFALVRCVAAGVGVKDLEDVLDRRAMHLKRRPGNAKDYRIAAGDSILQKKASP